MLYMVEMDLPDRSQIADWHAWYAGHIATLLSVEGYYGAQRFEATTSAQSPFLAIHDVSGPELFTSVAYTSVGGPAGTGAWRARMTHWHRNVYAGIDSMPALAEDQLLALVASEAALPSACEAGVQWVDSVGLDGSIPRRGVLILSAEEGSTALQGVRGVTLYRPISAKFV